MSVGVVILGAAGRMGKSLVQNAADGRVEGIRLAAAVDRPDAANLGQDVGPLSGAPETGVVLSDDLPGALAGAQAVIDFTHHTATAAAAPAVAEAGLAWVIGTTGLDEEEMTAVRTTAETCPVVMAPNMSLGINLLLSLVEETAAALRGRGYDIEITERHHRKKKDAPSGTALGLGRAAAAGAGVDLEAVAQHGREGHRDSDRPGEEIGFHAVRGGDIVGDHTVLFAGEAELLEISHRATRRDAFAVGALQAAKWAAGREPGMYSMRDVLGLG